MTREISVINNAPHKGCNSSSCCSPAKLWRSIQTFIKTNDEKGLVDFFKDSRQEHIVRVALTSRITNDAAMFPPSQQHKLIRLEERKLEANKYLGKSFNDLNSLQLALMTSSESMVLTLLAQLKLYATRQELKLFLNHIWGQGNTSLHLAVFLKRHAVVKTLIDLGCQPDQHLNARKKTAIDCCYYDDQRMIHLLSLHKCPETTAVQVKPDTTTVIVPMTNTTATITTTTIVVANTNTQEHTTAHGGDFSTDSRDESPLPSPLQLEKEGPTQVKEEMTLGQCYLLLQQLQKENMLSNNKSHLSAVVGDYIHILANLIHQEELQFVRLAQLKKPPDIRKQHQYLQPPYDVLLSLSMTTMCC